MISAQVEKRNEPGAIPFLCTKGVSLMRIKSLLMSVLAFSCLCAVQRAFAAEGGPDPKQVQAAIEKGISYLKKRQGEDGSFAPKLAGPGVSALVAASLLRAGVSPDDPLIAKTLNYLEKNVQKDGGIYDKKMANYTTSVAVMAFAEANTKGKYDALIKDASKFLKRLQHSDTDPDDAKFGGVGYDSGGRPDLSNTQLFVDALLAAGVSKDDAALQRAVQFMSRCQNLPGETNNLPFAKKTT